MKHSPGVLRRKRWLQALSIAAIALAIKVLYVQERAALPDMNAPTMDAKYHDEWAQGLAFGEWSPEVERIRHEPFFRAPLYPYFVAAIYRVTGHNRRAVLVVQALLGCATILLLYLVTRSVFSHTVGILAMLLAIGYWPFTYFEGEILIPTLITLLDVALLLVLLYARRNSSRMWWAAAGVLLGVSAVARPNIIIVAPFVILWAVTTVGRSRKMAGNLAVFVATAAAVVAHVTVRNVIRGNDFVWIASQGGVNFYIGNNSQSNGARAVVPGTRADWWGGYEDAIQIASQSLGRPARPSEVSRYWWARGISFWKIHPRSALKLMMRKIILFTGSPEVSNNRQIYFRRHRSTILRVLPVSFGVLVSLAILGLIPLLRGGAFCFADAVLPLFLVVPYSFSIIAFFVTSRYRIPVVAFMIPLAAYGLHSAMCSVRVRCWRRVAFLIVVFGASLGLSSLNPFGVGAYAQSRGYYDLGVDYLGTSVDKAIECFNGSLTADGGFAPAWKMRGRAWEEKGNLEAAVHDYRAAILLDTTCVDAYFRIGVVSEKLGEYAVARDAYTRVLKLRPSHVCALTNMADIYMRKGDCQSALGYLRRALAVQPDFSHALLGMGFYYECTGEFDDAEAVYARMVSVGAARIRLIQLLMKRNRQEDAWNEVNELLEKFPHDEILAAYRERLLMERKDN